MQLLDYFLNYIAFLLNKSKEKEYIDFSTIISIISIFVDILVPLSIVLYFNNKFLSNRNLKQYHIQLCDTVLNDYNLFLEDLMNGKILYEDVPHLFKIYSIKFTHLDNENFKRFKTTIKLQTTNREIQTIVTESEEYNNFRLQNPIFITRLSLKPLTINKISKIYSGLLSKNGELINTINK